MHCHFFFLQDISIIKEGLSDIRKSQHRDEVIDIGETLNTIQADIASLKTKKEKPVEDFNTVLTDMKEQTIAAVKVIHEVKEAERRIKRGFETQKRYLAEQVSFLHNEVRKLDNTLSDVNKTFSAFVPEIKSNLENANTVFKETLDNSHSNSASMFSVFLDSTLESTNVKLSNITTSFVRLSNNFNETLTNVEENVKEGIEASLSMTLDKKLSNLESSINSEFTNVQGKLKTLEDRDIITNISSRISNLATHRGYFYPDVGRNMLVRLANTTVVTLESVVGRLEVYHAGKWGTVCDDEFENVDARVACAMFSRSPVAHAMAFGSAYSGQGTDPTWLDDVVCSGTESSIFSCGHMGFGLEDCSHGEDVAIYCQWNK